MRGFYCRLEISGSRRRRGRRGDSINSSRHALLALQTHLPLMRWKRHSLSLSDNARLQFLAHAIIVPQIEIDARSRSLMPCPPLAARLIWAEDNGRRNHDLYLSFRALCSVNFPLTAECRIQCRLVERQQQLSTENSPYNYFHILVAIKLDLKILALQHPTAPTAPNTGTRCPPIRVSLYLHARGRMSERSDTVSVNIAAQTTPGILAREEKAIARWE